MSDILRTPVHEYYGERPDTYRVRSDGIQQTRMSVVRELGPGGLMAAILYGIPVYGALAVASVLETIKDHTRREPMLSDPLNDQLGMASQKQDLYSGDRQDL